LVWADDVNVSGANINATNIITASVLVAGKKGGLEVNAEKYQCMRRVRKVKIQSS
jgi:hypothetical protein